MEIIVDAMLAHVARWLRMLGVSTTVLDEEDREILRHSIFHQSILITMDRELFKQAIKLGIPAVLLKTHVIEEALAFLTYTLKIPLDFPLDGTRCPICNTVLRRLRNRWNCPGCGKEYWIGSHYPSIMKKLMRARSISSSNSVKKYGVAYINL